MRHAYALDSEPLSPADAFARLRPLGPRFLLESAGRGTKSRRSFIGFGDESAVARRSDSNVLAGLREALAGAARLAGDVETPLAGGLVGYSTFELARVLNGLGVEARGAPLARYIAPNALLIFDHVAGSADLVQAKDDRAFALEIEAALAKPPADPLTPSRRLVAAPRANQTKDQFLRKVAAAQQYIKDGEAYQLVLSIRHDAPCELDPFDAYGALRRINPSPYMFFLEFDDLAIAGSSPETLASLDAGVARLRPIAGTRPRGAGEAEDKALAAALLADPKERAEHVMLVDLARNDLGRCASAGSVRVDPFMTIERYSHVMHMVSGVEARLADGRDAFDLFASAFPAGTLAGAPKRRALEIVAELEGEERGVYGGAVGYFSKSGGMDHAICIRTLTFADGVCSFQAGAGVVADSVPALEYEEIFAKSAAMSRALDLAGGAL